MKLNWHLLFCLLFSVFYVNGYAQYHIIPKPSEVTISSGEFIFSNNFSVESNASDLPLQKAFTDWVNTEAIKKIKANKIVQTKLSLLWVGAKKWKSFLYKMRLKEDFNPGEEGYVIRIEKNSILILAQTNKGLFYGFQSLKQLFKQDNIACGEIYDKPSFAIRAWQDDISRGPIPSINQLKKEIQILAHYKLNYLTLYTEQVYKYVSHPSIAPKEGLSAAEVIELREYAKQFYVQLIANQQSFGHLEKLLKTKGYEDLAENKHIISPANERTYPLLENFYKEQHASYQSNYFHINADETFGLGSGQNKALLDSLGLVRLYAYHINKIDQILKKQGNTLIMWSDIISAHPEIINLLPKDIILIPWAYDAAKSFKNFLQPIAKSGFKFWVAPGINNWLNVFPNQVVTQENIYNLVRDGYELGAKGVLNTTWDDDGFALFGNNWQGLIWGAELSWNAPEKESNSKARWEEFEENVNTQFWEGSMQKWVKRYDALHQTKVSNPLRNESLFEPILSFYPSYISSAKEIECSTQKEEIQSIIAGIEREKLKGLIGKEAYSYLLFSLHTSLFICEKNLFRIYFSRLNNRINNPYKINEYIEILTRQLNHLKDEFTTLYIQENKAFYLKENLLKFENLLKELQQIPFYFDLTADEKITHKGRKYTYISQHNNNNISYTWGNNLLSNSSPTFHKPFYSKQNLQLKAGVYKNGNLQFYREDSFIFHLAIGSIQHINLQASKYHPSYVSSGKMALVDGKIGSALDLKSGLWQGYSGADLQIDLALNKSTGIQSFAMGFYQNTPSWVILPKVVQIFTSSNGYDYTYFQTITHQVPINQEDALKHVFSVHFAKRKIKYLRILAKYAGDLPPNHQGAGNPSMMFADEIILR
jgi:hexosaminidase